MNAIRRSFHVLSILTVPGLKVITIGHYSSWLEFGWGELWSPAVLVSLQERDGSEGDDSCPSHYNVELLVVVPISDTIYKVAASRHARAAGHGVIITRIRNKNARVSQSEI